jgi:hypothetical protein
VTKLGHPSFKQWLPSHFGADKDCWEYKGTAPGRLLTASYTTCLNTENEVQVHQNIRGFQVDTRSEEFEMIYQNFISYQPSLIMETQFKLDKIINEDIKKDVRSDRQVLGPCHTIERLR